MLYDLRERQHLNRLLRQQIIKQYKTYFSLIKQNESLSWSLCCVSFKVQHQITSPLFSSSTLAAFVGFILNLMITKKAPSDASDLFFFLSIMSRGTVWSSQQSLFHTLSRYQRGWSLYGQSSQHLARRAQATKIIMIQYQCNVTGSVGIGNRRGCCRDAGRHCSAFLMCHVSNSVSHL